MAMLNDPRWSAINLDGTPASGAKLYVYENGTDNQVAVYADKNLQNRLSMPLVADGRGYFPVFFANTGTYRVRIETYNDLVISDISDITI